MCDKISEDEKWMRRALDLAGGAVETGDVPVGAVVVRDGEVIAEARNRREADRMATAHAEVLAIGEACRNLGRWRLSDCTLYVTLEPCPMCAGALINARIGRVVFGAKDPRAGAMGSLVDLPGYPLDASFEISGGVLEEESLNLLQSFFRERRKMKKN